MTSKARTVLAAIGTSTLALGLVLAGGCEGTTRSGAPYTQLITRELQSYLDGTITHVHTTARRVLEQDMGYVITEDSLDALEGVIRAETARGRHVRVETESYGENLTRIQVWVGPSGDRAMAAELLGRIDDAV